MAAIYAFRPVAKIYYTSKPYPLYFEDAFADDYAEEHNIMSIQVGGWDPETLSETFSYRSATLVHKISYAFYPDLMTGKDKAENLTEAFEFRSSTLTQQIGYVDYTHLAPDTLTEGFAFMSATLTRQIGYVYITQPPDNITENHTITGITLT